MSCIVCSPRGRPRSGFATTHGARLIDSTPPGQVEVALAELDGAGGGVDRLQAGGAEAVDRRPGDAGRQAGEQRRHPRDVAVVLAGLVGGAEVDVGDPLGVDAAALDHGADDVGGEVVGPHAGERAAVGAHRGADRVDYDRPRASAGLNRGREARAYPCRRGFRPRDDCAARDSWSACCVIVGHFYPGSSADLVDWHPTRSPEVEAQNEIDDVRQMIEAQNEMRRRRGAPEMTEEDLRQAGRRGRARTGCAARPVRGRVATAGMARALIVGCGCRGRLLGGRLLGEGWAVRGTSRRPEGLAAIEAAGIEPALADPDRPATLLDLVGDVTVVHWLLGSARAEPEVIAAIHGPRLERLLEKLVDTPVRGFVYEAEGRASSPAIWRGARRSSAPPPRPGASRSRWSRPTRATRPPGPTQMLAATLRLVR